ncbi:MAG: SDR family oxidoreductase [Chloroflexi bacterium]|nr:SDR family oxidoreductase [Chloroflexota bacterium]
MREMPFRLDDRVALITGAGSERGIGRAIAVLFAAAGAKVGLVDMDAAGAERNAAELRTSGSQAFASGVEVTEPDSVGAAVERVQAALGPVDVLVNAAGVTRNTPLWETSLAEFDLVLNVNLRGGFVCLQAVLAGMMQRRHGRVIWISSIAGKQGGGVFGAAHYAASKAGVIGLCHAAARQLGPYGITSNAIAPGLVTTDLLPRSGGAELAAQLRKAVEENTPVRRAATAEDVAHAALFLASEEASYVNGEVMDVNGGAYFD